MDTNKLNGFNFADKITPYFQHKEVDYYRIHGVDKLITGSRHLFCSSNVDKNFEIDGLHLDAGEWLGTGSFRNSFFLEPVSQLTNIRDINISIKYEGALRLKLMCAVFGKPLQILKEIQLVSHKPTIYTCPIGSPTDLPEASRIFFHIDALAGGAVVSDLCFCTTTPPQANCRLAVLLRTFGRTLDIKALLKRFVDAGLAEAYYGTILDSIDFWVLDTTTGVEGEYDKTWQENLNLRVLIGPNLGGGGNAGHLLRLFEDACRQAHTPPTELLILDDDLSISMESIARYFMFCAYRTQDVICSLPILMKSKPTTVWEDGGFWGRLNFHEDGDFGKKRNLFPNLLKHGLNLDGFENLDRFNALNICEYSTFIFYGMPMKIFSKIGYPASFFLRGDDIELSLRAQEQGVTMITNPNLAAWHEPAHSYGQEYMAILHGCIINFTYSEQGADYYCRYFEERFLEHSSINDVTGMSLYLAILTELVAPDSPVLSPHFQDHYLVKLKELGSVKMQRIPNADRERFEQEARANDTLLVPFVYPGYHKKSNKFKNIVVINHSMKAYRNLPACTISEKATIGMKYMELLMQLEQGFDQVRGRWRERLKGASSDTYWCNIRDNYAQETSVLRTTVRSVSNERCSVLPDPVSDVSVTKEDLTWWKKQREDLRFEEREEELQLSKELREQMKINMQIFDRFAAKSIDKDSDASKTILPSDFDPSVYLLLNKDVADANIDPAEHYLKYGIKEGRKYRLA